MKPQGLIILLAFLAVSTLGFSSMAHADHTAHHSCLFSLSNTCATLVDPINSALEHLSSLQGSIQASLDQSNLAALFLLAFLLVIVGFVSARTKLEVSNYFKKYKLRISDNLFEFKSQFLAWLSILYKRDPLVLITAR